MKDDIPIVSDQVRKDWDKLKKDYEALQSTVEDMLNKYMYVRVVKFFAPFYKLDNNQYTIL